jgi:hypothetical protein
MKSEEAKLLFRGKDKLNCVQAVLRAFQAEFGISDEDIGSAANAGGGKAEGGACGALHASRMLLNDPAIQQSVDRDFEAQAGSLLCKQIRKLRQLSCRECVALAARLLEPHTKTNEPTTEEYSPVAHETLS